MAVAVVPGPGPDDRHVEAHDDDAHDDQAGEGDADVDRGADVARQARLGGGGVGGLGLDRELEAAEGADVAALLLGLAHVLGRLPGRQVQGARGERAAQEAQEQGGAAGGGHEDVRGRDEVAPAAVGDAAGVLGRPHGGDRGHGRDLGRAGGGAGGGGGGEEAGGR
ncbi:hypothetical protein EG872_16205, partial [Enterococcus faecalis]